jgi:hypothetical protein
MDRQEVRIGVNISAESFAQDCLGVKPSAFRPDPSGGALEWDFATGGG